MNVDFSAPLRDIEGASIELAPGAQSTIGTACTNALLANYPDEQGRLSGDEKLARYKLACRVALAPEMDVPDDDIATLKALVAKMFSPVISGQVWLALAGE